MSWEYYFFELPRNYFSPERCFSLRRSDRPAHVLHIYLEFDTRHGRWHLVRNGAGAAYKCNTIMAIAGTTDDPPIDLALATLSLMGY